MQTELERVVERLSAAEIVGSTIAQVERIGSCDGHQSPFGVGIRLGVDRDFASLDVAEGSSFSLLDHEQSLRLLLSEHLGDPITTGCQFGSAQSRVTPLDAYLACPGPCSFHRGRLLHGLRATRAAISVSVGEAEGAHEQPSASGADKIDDGERAEPNAITAEPKRKRRLTKAEYDEKRSLAIGLIVQQLNGTEGRLSGKPNYAKVASEVGVDRATIGRWWKSELTSRRESRRPAASEHDERVVADFTLNHSTTQLRRVDQGAAAMSAPGDIVSGDGGRVETRVTERLPLHGR